MVGELIVRTATVNTCEAWKILLNFHTWAKRTVCKLDCKMLCSVSGKLVICSDSAMADLITFLNEENLKKWECNLDSKMENFF